MREVQVDWRAYFIKFCEVHGGDPVPVMKRTRWLFRDGWMYSFKDYMGPEYPPEPNLVLRLQRLYWLTRRSMLTGERKQLDILKAKWATAQDQYSAPLQVVMHYYDEDNKQVSKTDDLDLRMFDMEVELLDQQIADCDSELSKLKRLMSHEQRTFSTAE